LSRMFHSSQPALIASMIMISLWHGLARSCWEQIHRSSLLKGVKITIRQRSVRSIWSLFTWKQLLCNGVPLRFKRFTLSGASMSKDFTIMKDWQGPGLPFPQGIRRPDFRSSDPKRLIPQLQIKVPTISRWGKKMAVVVDQPFWDSLGSISEVDHVSNCDIAWFIMDYRHNGKGFRIEPIKDRVSAVVKAISKAQASTGRKILYFPNISGHSKTIKSQLDFALDHGVKGILISPFLAGLETVNYIAGNYPLIMVNPAMSGSLFNDPKQGIAPGVILGTLFLLIGANISIYPSAGGRFPFTPEDCQRIRDALLTPDMQVKKSFPAPAGELKISTAAQTALEYSPDTLLLMGGDLLELVSKLAVNTRKIFAQLDRLFSEDQKSTHADPACSICDYHSLQSNQPLWTESP